MKLKLLSELCELYDANKEVNKMFVTYILRAQKVDLMSALSYQLTFYYLDPQTQIFHSNFQVIKEMKVDGRHKLYFVVYKDVNQTESLLVGTIWPISSGSMLSDCLELNEITWELTDTDRDISVEVKTDDIIEIYENSLDLSELENLVNIYIPIES